MGQVDEVLAAEAAQGIPTCSGLALTVAAVNDAAAGGIRRRKVVALSS